MSEVIQQSQLRNDNATVMRRVASGESFVVTVNGRAVADVIPHRHPSARGQYVSVAQLSDALDAVARPSPAEWRADLATAESVFAADVPADPFAPTQR